MTTRTLAVLALSVASGFFSFGAQADWLSDQSQVDGRIATLTDLSTTTQATSEAIRTLRTLGRSAEASNAESYLATEPHRGTEYLARRLIAKADAGIVDPGLVVELQSHQNADGGFGEFTFFSSDALDTALAIEALAVAGQSNSASAGYAVGYLLQSQRGDGAWSDASGAADVFTSAIVARGLYPYRSKFAAIPSAVANASNFLLAKRQVNGTWGESFLTAQALLTLSMSLTDVSSLRASETGLRSSQLANGSWENDVYSTALAMRALFIFGARNAGATPNATGGVVAGYVLRAGSSEPLVGVAVMLAQTSGASVLTNADGYFVLNGVPPGDQTILASKAGFGLASKVAAVRTGQFNSAGEIYLAQNADQALLSGAAYDSSTGLPLGGVAITLTGTVNLTATSAADGSFSFGPVTAGSYALSFQKSGYYNVAGTVNAPVGSTTSLRQGLLQQGAYLETAPGALSGRVIDAVTDQPISAATLNLGSNNAVTGTSGLFTLSAIARGEYQMQISASGYNSAAVSFVFASGTSGDLGTIRLYPIVGSQSPTTVTLVGTVVDAIDNRPLPGASVAIDNTGLTATSDALGKFRLENLTTLSFNVTATAVGHETRAFAATVSAYGEVAGTFPLPPTGGSSSATTTTINGFVKDFTTNAAIGGARVEVPGTSFVATTATDGSFAITNIDTLKFSLYASAPSFVGNPYAIELTQHGTYTIDINLNPDAAATGAVIQILSLNSTLTSTGANAQQTFAARIANLTAEQRQVVILADIVDAAGIVVATTSPFAPGTQTRVTQLGFEANQTLDLVVPWDTAQLPPGAYRLVLYGIQAGSISRELTHGVVLAQGEASAAIIASQSIAGQTSFDPPLTQAGATTPVALSALVLNTGNVPLIGATFILSVKNSTAQTIHAAQLTVGMLEVGNSQLLNFGSWIPTGIGNLTIDVRTEQSDVVGSIAGTLYVGDKASGVFAVDRSVVPIGTHTVRANVALQGVDVRTGASTDPLFFGVREAVRRGGLYVGPQVKQWNEANRCLGCHIQTQSFMGLAAAKDKAQIDPAAVQYLYNDLVGALQSTGQVFASHGDYHPQTETSLASWAFSNWHDSRQIFRTAYRAANHLSTRMNVLGNQGYWSADHCGVWYCNNEAQTMTVVKGMSAVLRMSTELGSTPVNDYVFDDTGFASGIRDLMGMQKGPDGQIWYLDTAGGLYARDLAGSTTRTIATGFGGTAVGLAIRSDGTAFVSSRSGLYKIAPNGTRTTILGSSSFRWDVAIGPDGAAYVADNNIIQRIDANDQVSTYVSGGLLNQVTGLSFAADGTLYASNAGSYNILKVALDRTVSIFADGLTFQPTWLRRGGDGYLYASTQQYNNTGTVAPGVYRIDAQGYVERLPIFNAPNIHGQNALGVIDGEVYVHNASNQHLYRLRITQQETSRLPAMVAALESAARFTLARYNDNNSRNDTHAMRLITLAEARTHITDSALLTQINTAITDISTLLRNRQRTNGGWTDSTGRTDSDAYSTAFVGLALDYTNPSVNDPMVRNSITYLINSQSADNSWPNNNAVFTTRLGTTSFVMAYLPLALERLGGIDADLNVSIPSNIQLSNPSLAPSTQQANADGSISYKWSLQGVTARTRNVDFDLTVRDMAFNEDRPVATAAYLEFANSFSSEKLRTNLVIPHVQASRDLSLDVTADRTSYPAQTEVAITSRVTNIGPAVAAAQVHLVIRHNDGTVVSDLGTVAVGPLATNATLVLPAIWNTGAFLAGGYNIYGQLLNTNGVPIYEDAANFEIVTGSAVVGATITPDKPTYQAWDAVSLASRIRNLAANTLQPNSVAEVTVQTPSGQTLFFSAYNVGELAPSALRDVSSPLNLVDAVSGVYPINLVVKDAFTRNVVATASSSFRVVREDIQAIAGNVRVANTQVYQGDTSLCTDTVTNLSSTAAPGVLITRKLVSLASTVEIESANVSLNFAARQTQILPRSVATRSLPLGGYACVLSATVSGITKQLGAAGFEVIAAPIRIDSGLSLGKHGRVLVLVDAPSSPTNANDPFGPSAAPDLNIQRAHIESVLESHGWSYKIVNNDCDFETEFNTGGYEVVVVFAEVVKIPEALQDRVVAEVAKGLGLIVAGNHDNRNGRLYNALGIKSTGKNLDVSALSMLTSEVMPAQEESFPVITPPNAIKLDGATQIARYRLMNPKPNQAAEPAVTLFRYGQGKGVYAGFDLPLEGAAAGDDSLFGELFAKSLDFVHVTMLTPYAKRVAPVELTLTNLGVATQGRVIVTLPAGAKAIDVGDGIVQQNGTVIWNFTLVQNQVLKLPFWFRLPNVAGDVAINAHIQLGTAGNYQDYADTRLVVRVGVRP